MPQRFSLQRLVAVCAGCFGVLAVAFIVAVRFGEQPLDWSEVTNAASSTATILFSVRLPRVVLAGLVGLALAVSGSTLQALMRNPLADPFVLGVSGGAGLGATVALAMGFGGTAFGLAGTSAFALGGALAAMFLVLAVGRMAGGSRTDTTLLAGVIFNAFALAAIIFIKALVAPDALGSIYFWLSGRLSVESPLTLALTATLILGAAAVMVALSGRLNVLSLGDDDARSLGLHVERVRLVLLIAASLAVAGAVAVAGLIGFVGLLVPHLARLLFGADNRVSLPASALLGAAFLMLADLASRALFQVFNTEPPVGVITAMLGGPLFLLLLGRRVKT